jgi:hypothetical protein
MNDFEEGWWWDPNRLADSFRAEIVKAYPSAPTDDAIKQIDYRVKMRLRTFHRREEWPAFLYELGRRTVPSMKRLPIWPDLPKTRRTAIFWNPIFEPRSDDLLAPPFSVAMTRGSVQRGPDWTEPMAFSIRLGDNDATIVGAFKGWLRVERARHHVPNPKANTGKRRRPLSWQYVEDLDLPTLEGDTVKSSMRSKAKKMAKKYITRAVIDVFQLS